MRYTLLLLAITIWCAGGATYAASVSANAVTGETHNQTPATAESVIGEVVEIDKQARTTTLKTDRGAALVVKADDKATCLRVPAGETTLAKATAIQFGDIGIGDRVLARGQISEDKRQMQAGRLIVLPKTEVDKKRQHDLEDWRRRGLAGVVRELNPQTGEINLEARGPEGVSPVSLTTARCEFRRYAPGSVKFADAKPSSFGELKVGDQVRALGDRSPDGKALQAEEIVSGSFKTLGAVVSEVDLEKNEIKANTLDQKTPLVISIGKDSTLHRIPPQMAAVIAQRLVGGPGNPGAQRPAGPGSTPDAAGQKAAPASDRPTDIQQMIDGLPALTLADIKAGDVLAVTCTADENDNHIIAIKLVASIDSVLNAIKPAPGKRSTVALSAGLPAAFDFSAVQP